MNKKYINYALGCMFDVYDDSTFERLQNDTLDRDLDSLNIVYEGADERYIYADVLRLAKLFQECAENE